MKTQGQTQTMRSTIQSALTLTLLAAPLLAGDGRLAIRAGKIITQAGENIENGTIVIENGRITAVGAEVEVPWDVEVLDATHLTAFPGFVEAHGNRGMDRPNENIDVAPFLNIRDSIDPVNFYFEDSLRWGVTTINVQQGNSCVIGGKGMVVKPFGMTVEEMLVRPASGLKLSASPKSGKSRATQAQALRKTFSELESYLGGLVQKKKDGDDSARREALYQGRDLESEEAREGRAQAGSATWTVADLELIPRGEIDEKQAPLLDLVEGRIPAWFYCGAPMDVRVALEVARDNGFLAQTTLVLSSSCWKAVDEIAEAGVPVVLSSALTHIERHPVTGDEIETFVPKIFKEKGVRYALASSNQSTQSLWFQAATCVAQGMSRTDALAAVTTVPADILGLGKRVGSIEKGKDGNVLLLSGDPLSVTSFVEYVVLEGSTVYDRSQDVRARHLMEGETPEGTAPAGAQEPKVHEHDDEVVEEEEPVDAGEEGEEK
ncbi:MAG TPA: amidohydrolase family protein [Planctomycetota bacterium]|nr:amidohydrolase family protein [Planctomycetota bacterium]